MMSSACQMTTVVMMKVRESVLTWGIAERTLKLMGRKVMIVHVSGGSGLVPSEPEDEWESTRENLVYIFI